jgi:hypothetical protein
VTATVGAGVMGLVRSVAWSYESFLVFEFLDPVFASGIYTAGFVLGRTLHPLRKSVHCSASKCPGIHKLLRVVPVIKLGLST